MVACGGRRGAVVADAVVPGAAAPFNDAIDELVLRVTVLGHPCTSGGK